MYIKGDNTEEWLFFPPLNKIDECIVSKETGHEYFATSVFVSVAMLSSHSLKEETDM
jgi:hypothetical protein